MKYRFRSIKYVKRFFNVKELGKKILKKNNNNQIYKLY